MDFPGVGVSTSVGGRLFTRNAFAVPSSGGAPAPTATSINPSSGPLSGGTSVTITGNGFVDGAIVQFTDGPATDVVVVSATSITCKTPQNVSGPGGQNVAVQNPDRQSCYVDGGFMYLAAPTISDISPSYGPVSGGTAVTITGTGFVSGATVTICGVAATGVTCVSALSITCTTGAGTAGTGDVVVTNPDAQTGTLSNGFRYDAATFDMFAVGGGGGGDIGGGGGGEVRVLTGITATPGTYSVVIGAGGAAGAKGGDTTFISPRVGLVAYAYGGGFGGGLGGYAGGQGGSGGGSYYGGASGSTGSGSGGTGYNNAGGTGDTTSGGGGGGAGAAGSDSGGGNGGNGGNGGDGIVVPTYANDSIKTTYPLGAGGGGGGVIPGSGGAGFNYPGRGGNGDLTYPQFGLNGYLTIRAPVGTINATGGRHEIDTTYDYWFFAADGSWVVA